MSLEDEMVTMVVVALAIIAIPIWHTIDPIKEEVKILVVS
jgi:hypothetical protein